MVIDNHEMAKQYVMEGLAHDAFRDAHDKLVDQKRATHSINLNGVYAKSRGYVARLAMIKDVLEQAVTIATEHHPPTWSCKVTESSVQAAAAIIYHLNEQKEIMMGIDAGSYIV